MEAVEELNRRNSEIINKERLMCTQKINSLIDETEDLKNKFVEYNNLYIYTVYTFKLIFCYYLYSLEYVHQICDELKKKTTKMDKENTELRKQEIDLKLDIENMNKSFENEVSKYL